MALKHVLGTLTISLALLGGCSKKSGDAASSGSGSGSSAAATTAPAGGGDGAAFMKLDTDKAAAFNAGGSDCAAKAKSVGDWRTQHGAEYKAGREKAKAAWPSGPPPEMADQSKANKKAVMGAMVQCSSDAAFSKMMDDTKAAAGD